MRYRADFHIHTDYSPNKGWHGEKPQNVAKALYDSDLDVAAVLEHNQINQRYNDVREEFAYLQDIERMRNNTFREVMILLGCEISCIFNGFLYHFGYVFELPYKRNELPDPPRVNCNLEEIEEYKKTYPGITIVFHPAWRDHSRNSYAATTALMKSGVIDGVEILNGSIFDNMRRHSNGKKAGEVKKWLRNFEFALEAYKKAKEALASDGYKLASIGCSDAHTANRSEQCILNLQLAERKMCFQR
jgi:hypothetical protein